MALGIDTTDKILNKVADGVGTLSDVVGKSNKKLQGAIEHNVSVIKINEANRVESARIANQQAEKTYQENIKANAKALEKNEQMSEKLQKQLDKSDLSDSLRKSFEEKKKKLDQEKIDLDNKVFENQKARDESIQTFLESPPVASADKMQLDSIDKQITIQEKEMKEGKTTRKQERDLRKLQKKKFQQELKMASPAEREEMLKDQAAKDKNMLTTLQKIGLRLKGEEGDKEKGDSMFTGPLKFLKGILLKGALLAFIMFLPKILDSQFMRDAIDFLQKTVIPQLKKFYEDAIVPLFNFFIEDIVPVLMQVGKFLFEKVLPIITDLLVKQIETFKNFFSDITAAFDKIFGGDILGGISDLILGIGKAILGTIDNIATAILNVVLSIFGLEGTDSIFGSIAGFFTGIYDTVVEFVSNAYNALVELITNSMIFKFFQETFTDIIDAIKGIFSGEDIIENLGKLVGSLLDIVLYPINVAINFIKDIFGFGNPDEPFRLSEFIGGIFTKIGDFFRNLFDIDVKALASKFLPKKLVDFVLGKDEKEAENLAAAEESGFYTKRGIGRDSRIDQGLVKFAPEGQLQAILADDDLADEDKQMIEKELQKRKLQKDLRKAGLGVPEQIDDFGGTDRAIREAAEREAASTNIVAPDQRVVSNSSTTVVQQETITPSYGGYSMVSTESDY